MKITVTATSTPKNAPVDPLDVSPAQPSEPEPAGTESANGGTSEPTTWPPLAVTVSPLAVTVSPPLGLPVGTGVAGLRNGEAGGGPP